MTSSYLAGVCLKLALCAMHDEGEAAVEPGRNPFSSVRSCFVSPSRQDPMHRHDNMRAASEEFQVSCSRRRRPSLFEANRRRDFGRPGNLRRDLVCTLGTGSSARAYVVYLQDALEWLFAERSFGIYSCVWFRLSSRHFLGSKLPVSP